MDDTEVFARDLYGQQANHHKERYLELLKDSKIKGYLFEQQNYVPKTTTNSS